MTGKMVESTWANVVFFLYQLDPKKTSEKT